MRDHLDLDTGQIQAAFDDVFDQAMMFHGFADYMRDHEVFIYATADPRTGTRPEHLRYPVQALRAGYALVRAVTRDLEAIT